MSDLKVVLIGSISGAISGGLISYVVQKVLKKEDDSKFKSARKDLISLLKKMKALKQENDDPHYNKLEEVFSNDFNKAQLQRINEALKQQKLLSVS